MGTLLEGRSVTRYFGGLAAVNEVDFDVQEGEILGLIGPNGAGKTTLMNLITGVYPLTKGEIYFNGHRISGLPPHRITQMGIARTFQIVKPFPGMTVRENVAVGELFGRSGRSTRVADALKRADEILEFVGLYEKRNATADELTVADRKRVELARALAMGPKLLLLDEAMAGLNPKEIEAIMDLIRQVNRTGVTVMVIEHVMKAIMGLCDRILVLHHGQRIALGTPEEVANDEAVIRAYLGERYAKAKQATGGSR
ncbi:MAG: ABC transporter ATP-binding protein [Anaerolineae bacterium]|nr:ABC transporter ATP-binding protein [Anaerolineae bacterium]